jgi:hypothetical protein
MEIINLKNAIELEFENIISNKIKCDDYVSQIEEIIKKINIKYNSLLTNICDNKNIEIPIYLGIDSLNFQNKLYVFKLENIKKLYNRIFNRIYADYYKIYKLIKKYIITNTTIPPIDINFIQYKDLDQDKYYSFDETIKIQNTINQYIQSLYDIISKKNITIQPFLSSDKAGYAVNNYITEENTNINIYKSKCLLFIKYLTTFNNYHNNYLLDFILQARFLVTTIKKDIDFNNNGDSFNIEEYINEETSSIKSNNESNLEPNKIDISSVYLISRSYSNSNTSISSNNTSSSSNNPTVFNYVNTSLKKIDCSNIIINDISNASINDMSNSSINDISNVIINDMSNALINSITKVLSNSKDKDKDKDKNIVVIIKDTNSIKVNPQITTNNNHCEVIKNLTDKYGNLNVPSKNDKCIIF